MESIEIGFALVGLAAAGSWVIFKSKWKGQYIIALCILLGFLALEMLNMFSSGIVAKDQAAMILGFGVGGVITAAVFIGKYLTSDEQRIAIGAVAVIMVAIMVYTFNAARPVSMPTIAAPSAPAAPTTYAPSASAPAPSGPAIARQPVVPTADDCEGYSDSLKRRLGCP